MTSQDISIGRADNAPFPTWLFPFDLGGSDFVLEVAARGIALTFTSDAGDLLVDLAGKAVSWAVTTATSSQLPLGRLTTYTLRRVVPGGEDRTYASGWIIVQAGPVDLSTVTVAYPGPQGPSGLTFGMGPPSADVGADGVGYLDLVSRGLYARQSGDWLLIGYLSIGGEADQPLAGTIQGIGSLSGAMTAQLAMAGGIAGAASLSAALSAQASPTGGVPAPAGPAGALTGIASLAGGVSGAGALTAALSALSTPAGTVPGGASLTAAATRAAALAGVVPGSATLGASATVGASFVGAVSASAILTGTLSASAALGGTMAGAASLTASLSAAKALAGTMPGAGTLGGAATVSSGGSANFSNSNNSGLLAAIAA